LHRDGLERYASDATQLLSARREVPARVIPQYVNPIIQKLHYVRFMMSHEARTQRDIYRTVYGLPFGAANPGTEGGIDWLNHYMMVDKEREHPFRPGQKGFSRFFLIVDDNKLECPAALLPDALHGSDLARYQFKHW
jgi:hypothetical protein